MILFLLKSLQMVVLIKLRGGKFMHTTVFISLIVIVVLVIAFILAGAYLRKVAVLPQMIFCLPGEVHLSGLWQRLFLVVM